MELTKEINKLAERLKKQKVDLFVTDNCIDYLTELGYSKEFGARNMTRVIEDKIANQLVDEVLFGKLSIFYGKTMVKTKFCRFYVII